MTNEAPKRIRKVSGAALKKGSSAGGGDRGLYILALRLSRSRGIKAGRLRRADLLPGLYLYVGRARQHLTARLKRHLRKEKKAFWHIDYLLPHTRIEEIWIKSDFFEECLTAAKLRLLTCNASLPIIGFGSSDCRCPSHLIRVPKRDKTWRNPIKNMEFTKAEIHEYQA